VQPLQQPQPQPQQQQQQQEQQHLPNWEEVWAYYYQGRVHPFFQQMSAQLGPASCEFQNKASR
jgi:hypothetical protein